MDREHTSSVASQSQEFLPLADVRLKGSMYWRSPKYGRAHLKLTGKTAPAYRRYARGAQKCYKPTSTRWPFLICVLLLTFGLIAIVEVACHNFPVENYQSSFFGLNLTHRDLTQTNKEVLGVFGLRRDGTIKPRQLLSRNETSQSSPPESPSATSPGAYIPTTTSRPAVAAGSSDDTSIPQPVVTTAYIPPSSYIPPETTDGGAYLPTTTYTELSTTVDGYIPTDPTIYASTQVSGYIPEGASIPTSSASSVVTTITLPGNGAVAGGTSTTIPGAYITTTVPPSAVTTVVVGATSEGAYVTTHSGYHPFKTILSGYLDPTDPSGGGPTVNGGEGVSTTITLPDGDPTGTTIPDGYIPTSNIPVPSATDGAYIPTPGAPSVLTTVTLPQVGPTGSASTSDIPGTESGAFIPVTQTVVPISTVITGGTAVVMMGTPTTTAMVPISTITSGGVAVVVVGLPTSTPLVPISTITSGGSAIVLMGTPPVSSLVPISTIITGGITEVVYGSPARTGTLTQPITSKPSQTGSYSVITTLVTSTSGSVAYVYNTTMTLGPTTSIAAATQAAATTAPVDGKSTQPFTPLSYFTAWYLPTIVAVVLRTIWTVVYNNARMMEPFYRLASPAGVSGRHALNSL